MDMMKIEGEVTVDPPLKGFRRATSARNELVDKIATALAMSSARIGAGTYRISIEKLPPSTAKVRP
jgi:hypothetical protein